MEKAILGRLEWYLTVPTPYVFLVRYIKAAVPSDQEVSIYILNVNLLLLKANKDCWFSWFCGSLCCFIDGEHDIFLGWAWADELHYRDILLSIKACCFCCLCCSKYSQQEPSMDWHSEASHWLLRRPAEVKKKLNTLVILGLVIPRVYELIVLVVLFETGKAQSNWLASTLVLLKTSWRQFIGSFRVQILLPPCKRGSFRKFLNKDCECVKSDHVKLYDLCSEVWKNSYF